MTIRISTFLCVVFIATSVHAQNLPPGINRAQGKALPEGAILRLGSERFVAPGGRGIALSPDGARVALGAQGGMVIWNADQARLIHDFSSVQVEFPSALAWSANGRMIAVVSSGRDVSDGPAFQLWDAATGYRLRSDLPRPLGPGSTTAYAARFVADDCWLTVVLTSPNPKSPDRKWQVQLWSVASGKLDKTWNFDDGEKQALIKGAGDGYDIRHVALSPSGARMAWLASPPADSKDRKSAAFIFDTASGKLLHRLTDLPATDRINLADEGETVVLRPIRPASVEKMIVGRTTVVNVADGRTRFQCDYRFRPARFVDAWGRLGVSRFVAEDAAVRFGDALLTMDEIGIVRWDYKTGKKLEEFEQPIETLAISANGKRIAVRDQRRFGVSDKTLASLNAPGGFGDRPALRFLKDGRLRGSDALSYRDGMLHVWSGKGKLLESRRLFALPSSYEDSGQADLLGTTMVGSVRGGFAATFDLTSAERLALFKTTPNVPQRARLSGDGRRVLVYEWEKQRLLVRWFDSRNGRELGSETFPLDRLVGDFDSQADWFSEDGSIFGYRDSDLRLTLVSCDKGKAIARTGFNPSKDTSGHKWAYHSAGFDQMVWARPITLSGGVPDKSVPDHKVWDRQGRLLRRFVPPLNAQRTARHQIDLSADGRLLVYEDSREKAIVLVDTCTGRPRGRIHVPQYSPFVAQRTIAFSPDGLTMATSADNSILLWDLARPLWGKPACATPKNIKEAEALWEKLGDLDPTESDLSLWALVKSPEHALALLTERLKPVPLPDAKPVQALIRKLDSANFAERDAAQKELDGVKASSLSMLRKARESASTEQRRRLDEVIASMQARLESPDAIRSNLRELRALELLERIGTPEARKLVESIASGAGAVPTYEAQLILARWQHSR